MRQFEKLVLNTEVTSDLVAKERPDAGREFGKGKRFDQVIVGTSIESQHPIFDGVFRGQEKHGCFDSTFAHCGKHLNSAPPRQQNVEDNEIELFGIGEEESVFASMRNGDKIRFAFKTLLGRLGDLSFVFDYKDSQTFFLYTPSGYTRTLTFPRP